MAFDLFDLLDLCQEYVTRSSDRKFLSVWMRNGKQFVMVNSIVCTVKFAKRGHGR